MGRRHWIAGVVAACGGAVLFVSLFLPWYGLKHEVVTSARRDGSFVFWFWSALPSSDGWSTLSAIHIALAVCAVAVTGLAAVRLFAGSQVAAVLALIVALLAVGLTAYRVLEPPTRTLRPGVNAPGLVAKGVSVPLSADYGAFLGLAAAVGAAASSAWLLRLAPEPHG